MSDFTVDVQESESQDVSADLESGPETLNDSPSNQTVDSLDELRDLLLGEKVAEHVAGRLASYRVDPENIADVLPQALTLTESRELVSAVRPTVEDAIKDSVAQEQEILADALFPIIGPATRKAVTTAIKTLADSLNQGLELSLSPKSVGWRIEAWRTGRPFAEVVLLRTLLFQVEQVLLIHKETGLMLQDVVAETVTVQDPDLVSSMLTAIEDFVKDSFTTKKNSFLDSVEFGDLTLWIEDGPRAVLACAIRGVAPKSLRPQMQETLEAIHRQFDPSLESFSGDRTPFASSQSYLRSCLLSQSKPQEKKRSPVAWIGAALLIGILILAARAAYVQFQWKSAIRALDTEPGIMVLKEKRGWTRGSIKGLRDPLAPEPVDVMQANGIQTDNVTFEFEPYWSLSPQLMEIHVNNLLAPPPDVNLRYEPETQTLSILGKVSYDWIERANQFSNTQPRIARLDTSQLKVLEIEELNSLQQKIEKATLKFREGVSSIDTEQLKGFDSVTESVREITTLAAKIRQPLKIYVLGQASSSGSDEYNVRLSQARADSIVRRLTQAGVPGEYLKAEGMGVSSKFGQSEVRKAQVNFRVEQLQP